MPGATASGKYKYLTLPLRQLLPFSIFTARCYASAVLAMGLCLSVTSRSSTITAKCRITQTTPHDSPGTLVF